MNVHRRNKSRSHHKASSLLRAAFGPRPQRIPRYRPGDILEGQAEGYRILSAIKAGALGQTYKARGVRSGRDVVIKVPRLPSDLTFAQQQRYLTDLQKGFALEELLLHRLKRTRGVAHLLDHGLCRLRLHRSTTVAMIFLVQEFVDGERLDEFLASKYPARHGFNGVPNSAEFFHYAREIAWRLRAIHRAQVVHGDVWYRNIMVDPSGHPVFIDLGQGWLNDVSNGHGPAQLGNHVFRDPAGGRSISADIYGLGGVLHFLATGQNPPEPVDNKGVLKSVIVQQLQLKNLGLLQDNPGIADLIARCRRVNPAERYRTVDALLEEIDRFAPMRRLRREPRRLTSLIAQIHQSKNGIFTDILRGRITHLIEEAKEMLLHGMYDCYGDHETMVARACDWLKALQRGDSYLSVSIPNFWSEDNLGVDGRFLSMNLLAAKHGATIRRVFLLTRSDLAQPDVCVILKAQLRAIRELQREKGLQTENPEIAAGGYYVGFARVTESEKSELIAQGNHFGLIYRKGSGVLVLPTYDRNRIVGINFRCAPSLVRDSKRYLEKLLATSRPLSQLDCLLTRSRNRPLR